MENGSHLSIGQKQWICLAQAILRKGQILVIDERILFHFRTAELIQQAIRNKFQDWKIRLIPGARRREKRKMTTIIQKSRRKQRNCEKSASIAENSSSEWLVYGLKDFGRKRYSQWLQNILVYTLSILSIDIDKNNSAADTFFPPCSTVHG